jgi:hypothetical protein
LKFQSPCKVKANNLPIIEEHEPEQDAFGDWAAIAIGGQYYLVADYDPAGSHDRSGMSFFQRRELANLWTKDTNFGKM